MAEEQRPIREVAFNRKARRDYEILDRLEAGLSLQGTEVKTLRAGRVSLDEAYVKAEGGELWLVACHIEEYAQGNIHNHDPLRPRKILVRKRELARFRQRAREKGLTLIPIRIYFRGRWAKVEVGLARGRKRFDKREGIRQRETERAMRRVRLRRR